MKKLAEACLSDVVYIPKVVKRQKASPGVPGATRKGGFRMRYVIAAMLACLLTACGSPPPRPSCTTPYQCEIEQYQNMGRGGSY